MKLPKIQKQIKIKIVFNSGYTHVFWIKDLHITDRGQLEWEHIHNDNQLLEFKPDEISCIIRVGSRNKIIWK